MAKIVAVTALVVVAMLLAVPSMGMRFDQEDVNGVMPNPNGGASRFRPDEASKQRLWKKVQAAVAHNAGSILAPNAKTVGDTVTADATAHIGSTLFNKLGALISGAINTYGKSVVIPGESTSHFSFSDIHFSEFNVGSIDFAFTAPNQIRFSINDLNIVIPSTEFHVYAKVVFVKVSCHGYFNGEVTGTSLAVDLTLATDAATQKLTVTGATSTVNFGVLSIHHTMSDFLCKVGQSIIQLFLGNIDSLITKFIKEKLPADVGPIIQKVLNNEFVKLPLKVIGAPTINTEGISVLIDVMHFPDTSYAQKQQEAKAVAARSNLFRIAKPAKGSLVQRLSSMDDTPMLPPTTIAVGDSSRDINVIVTETNVNNMLLIEQLKGKINVDILAKSTTTSIFKSIIPAAYNRCPDCRLYFTITAPTVPPTVNLHDNNVLSFAVDKLILSISAVNSSNPVDPPVASTIVPLFDLALNGTVQLLNLRSTGTDNTTIMFQLGVPVFALFVDSSSVGPIPLIPTVSTLLRGLIENILIPLFNDKFTGIPFPPSLVQDVLALVSEDQVNVGLNLIL